MAFDPSGQYMKNLKPVFCLLAIGLSVCGCGHKSEVSFGADSRLMAITGGYSEIVVDSAKIPGYWAVQSDGEKFFLYTRDRSFNKGDIIRVEGIFGGGSAAVFDEETRVYRGDAQTNIFVVWKAAPAAADKTVKPPADKVSRK